MKLENHSKTAKRLRGIDTRPGHKGKTLAGKILATKTLTVKGLYDQAVEVLRGNLQQGDLKAAIFAIEQVDGKAKQKVDVTTNGKDVIQQQPDIKNLSPEAIQKISDALIAIKRPA